MKLTFLGAAREVTGSRFLLQAAGKNIMVDYGMEQGVDLNENAPLPIINIVHTVMGKSEGISTLPESRSPCAAPEAQNSGFIIIRTAKESTAITDIIFNFLPPFLIHYMLFGIIIITKT